MPRCYDCGLVTPDLKPFVPCQTPRCRNHCDAGSYCPTCQNKIPQLTDELAKINQKYHEQQTEYYFQLQNIAHTLGIPFSDRRNYNLTDPKWSNFFPSQVKTKWEQLKTTSLTPEVQHSELLSENKSLTTTLNLKDRELKDLQAEIRALEVKLDEKESSSAWQVKITKLESKLNLIKNKLAEWSKLVSKN